MPHFLKIRCKQAFCIILFLTNCNIKSAYFTQEPKFEEIKIFTHGDSYKDGNLDLKGGAQWDYLYYKLVEQKRSYEDLLIVYKLSHDAPWYDICKKIFEKTKNEHVKLEKDDIAKIMHLFNSKKKSMEQVVDKFVKDKSEKKSKKMANLGVVESIVKKIEDDLADSISDRISKAICRKTEKKQMELRKKMYKTGYEDEIFVFATKQGNFYFSIFGKLMEEPEVKKMMEDVGIVLYEVILNKGASREANVDNEKIKIENIDLSSKDFLGMKSYILGLLFLSGLYFMFSNYIS